MRKLKQMSALVLAGVVLSGVLALPASAATRQEEYTAKLKSITESQTSSRTAYRNELQNLMKEYPESPEPYYRYVASYKNQWLWKPEEGAFQAELVPQLVSYLDTAIQLSTQTENPLQARWSEDKSTDEHIDEEGSIYNYDVLAAEMKADLQMWTLGQQEQSIASTEQYLQCWNQKTTANLKTATQLQESGELAEKYKQKMLKEGYSEESAEAYAKSLATYEINKYNNILNQTIPDLYQELEEIRQWNVSKSETFDVGTHTESGREGWSLKITGQKGGSNVSILEYSGSSKQPREVNIVTTQPIREIQRTLGSMAIFVPCGTEITITQQDYSMWYIENIDYETKTAKYTAEKGIHRVAMSSANYNNAENYCVYIVGV